MNTKSSSIDSRKAIVMFLHDHRPIQHYFEPLMQ
jgi:hypothetical protein